MLEPYRRHTASCPHISKGQSYSKCSCPIWVYGNVNAKPVRKSLQTKDWQRALRRIDKLEAGADEPEQIPIKSAVEEYLRDCRTRNLAESTLVSYKNVLEPLAEHCKCPVQQISSITLSSFRSSRAVSPSTSRKELQCLRGFFAFCVGHKWSAENPAKVIKPPKEDALPTLPFSKDEITGILAACDKIKNFNVAGIQRARLRAKALVLLLLYSGMRISDAVRLERKRLEKDGRLLLSMQKTKQPLYIKLNQQSIDALHALPVESECFFWSKDCKLSTAVGSARRTIEMLMRLAGIKDGHPHRFRDTFAVRLLLAGVDIRKVSLLLGHKSVRTTEKHYAPFVAEFQKQLDDAVSKLDFT